MRKFLSIIVVAALVATTANAGVFSSMAARSKNKKVAPKADATAPKLSAEERKIAENAKKSDENYYDSIMRQIKGK